MLPAEADEEHPSFGQSFEQTFAARRHAGRCTGMKENGERGTVQKKRASSNTRLTIPVD
jgi:hypothetical protein